MMHTATQRIEATERPWWKTLLVATLLMFIPLLGWGMAATYMAYRGAPQNFRWAEAFFNALLLTVMFLVLSYIFWHQIDVRIWQQIGFVS